MLFMFARMTMGTTHTKGIRFVAVYVLVGWVSVQIAFFTACRPFKGYWAVPPPDPQCTTFEHYAIVQAVFNLSSDLLIIAIPIPMIASLSLPLKQKFGLGLLFSMGIFVVRVSPPLLFSTPTNTIQIVAAILTKIYNLSNIYATTYMHWYTREASVAVYVTNLPGIWPLLRENIRFLREHTGQYASHPSKPPAYGYGSQYGVMSSKGPRSRVTDTESDEIELGTGHAYAVSEGKHVRSGRGSVDSDEKALREGWTNMGVVQVDTKVEVTREMWEGEAGEPQVDTTIEGGRVEAERR
jgi:hypothetical protein